MAEPPKEDRKFDISSLPRTINIKGLPVNRNTRLPSIRSPRDLTLGGPPKRTFMPNIPVRREKKAQVPEEAPTTKEIVKTEKRSSPHQNDRGRGRGRRIVQSDTSIFSGENCADTRKERTRAAYSKSDFSGSSKGISIKKEKRDPDVAAISKDLDQLFRDDFIDDGDDDDIILSKPTVFPPVAEVKREKKEETNDASKEFNPDIAKEMDFDVNLVAKFIKKEKGTEAVEKKKTVVPTTIPSNEIINVLRGESSSNLTLLQFPDFINMTKKMDDSEPSPHNKSNNVDPKASNVQDDSGSIKSLPEGYIGKLQITKSGKVKLVIDSVEFSLDPLESMRSRHEVASVITNADRGDLTMLGHLEHKLVFVPNLESVVT